MYVCVIGFSLISSSWSNKTHPSYESPNTQGNISSSSYTGMYFFSFLFLFFFFHKVASYIVYRTYCFLYFVLSYYEIELAFHEF